METEIQMRERNSMKAFNVLKSHIVKVIITYGYDSRFDQAFEYFVRVRFHNFKEKLIQNLNQLEMLLKEEELHPTGGETEEVRTTGCWASP
ncbi:hypothetical protein CTI12_AA458530 [Artemisia annua]|uniref:Uncharacterized protein n=1 Tax=Artemisia annua TaxID=35608 RepID=A0A2U1L0Q2_ARTAN|nr:hypothetical protein CTI12_AA458530 [Artemisia annua]